MKLRDIKPITLAKYKDYLVNVHKLSPRSINRKISSLKRFLNWANNKGYTSTEFNQLPVNDQSSSQKDSKAKEKTDLSTSIHINTYSKEEFAPFLVSKTDWPFFKRLFFHLKYTRPAWYRKYHSIPLTNYLHFAILILFVSFIGFGLYRQLFETVSTPFANPAGTTNVNPSARYLSFQGRLTDSSSNPITVPTNMRFAIYNDGSTATGAAQLWEELRYVVPDTQDGIFNILLGEAVAIAGTIFSENGDLWLGVTVDRDAEATPRQRIATVGYAQNAEFLQGHPPSASVSANQIPVMTQSGDFYIAQASPRIYSASGGFKIEGQTLTFETESNGNISIAPNNTGRVLVTSQNTDSNTFDVQNSAITVGNLIYGYAGNDNSGYNLLKLTSGSSETVKFAIDQSGNATAAGDLVIGGIDTTPNISTTNMRTLTIGNSTTGTVVLAPDGTTALTADSNDITLADTLTVAGVTTLQSTLSVYGNTIGLNNDADADNLIGVSSGGTPNTNIYWGDKLLCDYTQSNCGWATTVSATQYWQENSGVLSPANITDDLLIGLIATPSSSTANYFQIYGTGTTEGDASSSGILTLGTNRTTAIIETEKMIPLTLGSATTGPIQLSPKGTTGLFVNGAGSVGIGTTSPSTLFEISSASTPQFRVQDTTNYVTFDFAADDFSAFLDFQNTAADSGAYFRMDGTTALFIKTDRNVGIGTTAPAQELDIAGNLNISGALKGYATASGSLALGNVNATAGVGNLSMSGTLDVNGTGHDIAGTLNLSGNVLTSSSTLSFVNSSTGLSITTDGVITDIDDPVTIGENLDVTGSVRLGAAGAGNLLNTSAGSAASNDLFWGDDLLCDFSETNCGWATSATSYWTRVAGNLYPATANDTISATSSAATVATFTQSDATKFALRAGGSTAATTLNVLGSGLVGIGTTAPAQELDIAGNLNLSGALKGYATASGSLAVGFSTVTAGVGNAVFAGSVGIGTSTPEALLEVQGGEGRDAVLVLDADEGDDAADTWFVKSLAADNSLSFVNNATEVMNLTSAGLLQIDSTLSVSGNSVGINNDSDADNILTVSAASTPNTNIYWGDKLLCDYTQSNCGWATSAGTSKWQENSGVLSPLNITDDVLVGLIATPSSSTANYFQIFGTGTTAGDATSSGILTLGTNRTTAIIETEKMLPLTIGSSTTGAVTIDNGSGPITLADNTLLTSTFTLGDNGDTGSINTSDWDIDTSGNQSGIGTIGMDGDLTITQADPTISMVDTGGDDYTINVDANAFTIINGSDSRTELSFAGDGSMDIGDNTATKTIDIGGVTSSDQSTINIATNATAADTITIGNTHASTTLTLAGKIAGNLIDNIADAFDIQQGTDNYINISTSDTQANISFGNASTNPTYNFLGSGLLSTAGAASVSGTLTVGNGTTNQIRAASGDLVLTYKSALDTWSPALTIRSVTGNVGIGTTNPSSALDVTGAGRFTTTLSVEGNTIGLNNDADVDNLIGVAAAGGAANSNLYWGNSLLCNFSDSNCGWATSGGSTKWQENSGVLSPLNITDDVLVGLIATPSSSTANYFQIFGTGTTAGDASSSGILTLGTNRSTAIIETERMLPLTIGSATTGPIQLSPKGTTGLTVSGAGYVGIGTTAPGTQLQVSGAGTQQIRVMSTDSGGADVRILSDTTKAMFGTTSNLPVHFYSNNTANMVLDQNGNVGIGTTSPSQALDVVGNLNISGALKGYATASGSLAVGFSTVTAGVGNAVFAGSVGIGTSTPEALLEVQGGEGRDAVLVLDADEGDDAADTWSIESEAADNDLSFVNDTGERMKVSSGGTMSVYGAICPGNAGIQSTVCLGYNGTTLTVSGLTTSGTIDMNGQLLDRVASIAPVSVGGNINILNGSGGNVKFRFNTGATGGLWIGGASSDGNPTAALDVVGDASASGSLVLRGVSPFTSAVTLDILNGVRFDIQTSVGGDLGLAPVLSIINGGANNGYVGIGITAPTAPLDVTGSVRLGAAGAGNLLNTSAGSAASNDLFWGDDLLCDFSETNCGWATSATSYWTRVAGNLYPATANDTISATSSAATVATFTQSDATKFALRAGGSTAATTLNVLGSGLVGIGTTAPAQELDIAGNLNLSGALKGYATASGSLAVGSLNAPAGVGNAVFSGSVGIGATPLSNVQFYADRVSPDQGSANHYTTYNLLEAEPAAQSATLYAAALNTGRLDTAQWINNSLIGTISYAQINAAGTVNTLYGIYAQAFMTNAVAGNATTSASIYALGPDIEDGTGANAMAIRVSTPTVDSGTITSNAYGVKIESGAALGAGSMASLYPLYIDADSRTVTAAKAGLYMGTMSGGATNFQLYIAGTADSYIAGDVGIGTTSPLSALNVDGTTGITWAVAGNSLGLVTVGTGGTSGGSLWLNTASLNTSYHSGFAVDGTYSNPGGVGTSIVNLKAYGVNSAGGYGSALTFSTTSNTTLTEAMRITSASDVGIGVTTPAAKLDIDTASNTTGLRLRGLAETVEISDFYVGSVGTLVIDNTVGTDTGAFIDLRPEDDGYGLVLRESDGTGSTVFSNFYVVDTTVDYMNIVVNATTATIGLVIDDDNQVGIGVTAPDVQLDLSGDIQVGGDDIFGSYSSTNARITFTTTPITVSNSLYDSWVVDNNTNVGLAALMVNQDKAGDIFAASASASPKFVIQNDGDVGIGIAVPTAKLDIDTGSNTAGIRLRGAAETVEISDIYVDTLGQLVLNNTAGTDTGAYIDLRPEDDEYGLILRESDGTGSTVFSNFYVVDAAVDYMNIVIGATQATTGLVIDADEQVGIGVTAPAYALDVQGTSTVYGRIKSTTTGSTNEGGLLLDRGDSTNGYAQVHLATAAVDDWSIGTFAGSSDLRFYDYGGTDGERMRIQSSTGNVGIGTTAPLEILHIQRSDRPPIIKVQNSSGTQGVSGVAGLYLATASTTASSGAELQAYRTNTGSAGSADLLFRTTTGTTMTTRMALKANGNLGIGTTAPSQELDVAGNFNVSGTLKGYATASGSLAVGSLNAIAGVGNAVFSGQVGIGTTSFSEKLRVVGSAHITGILGTDGYYDNNGQGIYDLTAVRTDATNTYLQIQDSSGNSHFHFDTANERLGIGTTAPVFNLQIQDSITATAVAMIRNTGTASNQDGLAIQLDYTTPGASCNVGGGLCSEFITFMRGDGVKVGKIHAVTGAGSNTITYKSSGADYGEYFFKENPTEFFETGTVVSFGSQNNKVVKSSSSYKGIVGVVSETTAFAGGPEGEDTVLVGLLGQIRVNLAQNSSPISTGDPITSSTQVGKAMKSEQAGQIIGHALESWTPNSGKNSILVLVDPSWYDPAVIIGEDGILVDKSTGSAIYSQVQTQDINVLGNLTAQTGEIANAVINTLNSTTADIENLVANIINAREIFVEDKLTSPLIETDRLVAGVVETTEIKTSGQDLVVDLNNTEIGQSDFGKLLVKGNLETTGDALITGELTAEKIEAEDASISGTLYAGRIVSDEIVTQKVTIVERIQEIINKIVTEDQTQELYAGTTISSGSATLSYDELMALLEEAKNDQNTNLDSSTLGDINADTLSLTSNLYVYGQANLADAFVTGTITQGVTFQITGGNTVNVLNGTLYLQTLGGGVDIANGAITLDSRGNAVFAGNLAVKGTLSANNISSDGNDLTLDLGEITDSEASPTAFSSRFGKLMVKGKDKETIALIDSEGNASFSGQLIANSIKLSSDYSATEAGVIIASSYAATASGILAPSIKTNGTTGIGILPAGETEVVVFNNNVSNEKLIYLTPTSETLNKVVYVKSKKEKSETSEGYFVVAIDSIIDRDINFNWWIIN